jgi:hypothetical protein
MQQEWEELGTLLGATGGKDKRKQTTKKTKI